jgi:hypothetical protein
MWDVRANIAMKRLLLLLVLGIAVFAGGRALYRSLASDETRIGWLLQDEVDAFNGASVLNLMPHFAADYRDDTAGVDAQMLRGGVAWAWQNQRGANGQFAWHLELPEHAGTVTIDGDAATAVFPLELFDGAGDAAQMVWSLRVDAKLLRKDGEWWIARSTHQTIAGRAPSRR